MELAIALAMPSGGTDAEEDVFNLTTQSWPSGGGMHTLKLSNDPASMTMRSSKSSPTMRRSKSSPLRAPPPFQAPMIDKNGFATFQVFRPVVQEWDDRFQLEFTKKGDRRADNDMLQVGTRKYFSKPHDKSELKSHLATMGPTASMLLKSLDSGPDPKQRTAPITADGAPTQMPVRHALNGTMRDRDDKLRVWNDRWNRGTYLMNDELPASQRSYFSKESAYDTSPSQGWRRYRDQEVAPGQWAPGSPTRAAKFGPMGV